MTRPAISVQDVSVRFRPYVDRKPTLRRSIPRLQTRQQTVVEALVDVSFEVRKGEAFGVIGRNGAGKSTLMRCIARTLNPDAGKVVVNGRLSSLLQLGVGFNPELSGRQNIYLGCLANGLRRREVDEIADEIIEHTELESAIERPVKTYSSGMYARLGFSISMALKPDILLLDEILAVGDEGFREKSLQAMRELLGRSGTIVFVSHSLDKVVEFCDQALWLDSGRVQMLGDATRTVDAYRRAFARG